MPHSLQKYNKNTKDKMQVLQDTLNLTRLRLSKLASRRVRDILELKPIKTKRSVVNEKGEVADVEFCEYPTHNVVMKAVEWVSKPVDQRDVTFIKNEQNNYNFDPTDDNHKEMSVPERANMAAIGIIKQLQSAVGSDAVPEDSEGLNAETPTDAEFVEVVGDEHSPE